MILDYQAIGGFRIVTKIPSAYSNAYYSVRYFSTIDFLHYVASVSGNPDSIPIRMASNRSFTSILE